MKTKLNRTCRTAISCVVLALAGISPAGAQSTAFTYNGRLTGNGALASGPYDMQFTLYDANAAGNVVAGPLAVSPVYVANGLFTVRIDFGAGAFTGPARWLEVAVRTTGGGSFTPLAPRQEVTSSPYSTRSQSAGTADSGGGGNDSVWSVTANNAHYTNGYVGIGTTVPATPLEVDGIVRSARIGNASQYLQLDGGFDASDPLSIRLTAQSIPSAEKNLVIRNLSGEATPGANNTIQFAVGTTAAPSTKMTITKDGNVLMNPGGSGGMIQFGTPNFETGMTIIVANRADIRFDGSTLKLLASAGTGIPPSGNGIAINTLGDVGIPNKLSVSGNADFSGSVGIGTILPTSGKLNVNGGGGAGVYAEGTGTTVGNAAVYAKNLSGYAIAAEGNAVQNRDKGGFVKAMLFVAANGAIIRGCNPFRAGAPAVITKPGTGGYIIDFGFQVNDRFVSINQQGGGTAGFEYTGNFSEIRVNLSYYDGTYEEYVYSDTPFMIFV